VRHRLPPLNAIRAFEVVARLGSVTRAAEELSVSPGAVSRHVALLEGHLGARLFERHHRGVTLTTAGQEYQRHIAAAFRHMEKGSRRVSATREGERLRVRLPPTLATDWLPAKIDRFSAADRGIGLDITASLDAPRFDDDDVDIGVLPGPVDRPDLHAEYLFDTVVTPVCTQAVAEATPPLRVPADLVGRDLVTSGYQALWWRQWFANAGVEESETQARLNFGNSSNAYQAARQGAGVALGQPLYLLDDLRSGTLVIPFPLLMRHPEGVYLVCAAARRDEPAVAAFRGWLIDEMAASQAEIAEFWRDSGIAPTYI